MFIIKAKKILIWTLAVSFLLLNFFVGSPIPKTKGQSGGGTSAPKFDGGATARDDCIKKAIAVAPKNAPTEITLSGKSSIISEKNQNVNVILTLNNTFSSSPWTYQDGGTAYTIDKWYRKTDIVQTDTTPPKNHSIGSDKAYSAVIPLATGSKAVFSANAVICWQTTTTGFSTSRPEDSTTGGVADTRPGEDSTATIHYFKTEVTPPSVTIERKTAGQDPTVTNGTGDTKATTGTETEKEEVKAANTNKNTNANGDTQCEQQFDCGGIISAIRNPFGSALCRAQCAVIDFMSSILGWVIQHVLFPALGL